MFKRFMALVCVVVFSSNPAFSADIYDYFKTFADPALSGAQANLDNFAKDLGALMGGGSYHNGKALGLPGFDIGIHIPAATVSSDNLIVKQADLDTILLPIIQAEVGLPAKMDLIARFSTYENSTLIGAGLRYGIFKNSLPGLPSLSVQGVYNQLDVNSGVNKFKATTLNVSGIVSFNLPVINPYAGIGFDQTKVSPDSGMFPGLPALEGKSSGLRIEGGINMSLVPATYLQLGGSYVGGITGYTAGLGIKF